MTIWRDSVGVWEHAWGISWPTIDWGNAPAWVGAFLSGGSLLLALTILARDRSERRRASADKLATWWMIESASDEGPDSPDYEYVLTVFAYNANEAPLSHIVLEGNAGGTNLTQEWFNLGDGGSPESVQHGITYRVAVGFWTRPKLNRLYVVFNDAGGRYFVRNLATGRYLSARRARIWQKRH